MSFTVRKQDIREEGYEEGIEQGKKKKAIAIAKNMIAANVEIDFIVKMTGLTKDEVEALLQEKEYIKP